jgi:hypothetical protein
LTLAARQRPRLSVQVLLQAEDLRGPADAAVDLALRELAELEPERHVVVDGHVRVQGVALEDHRDVAFLRRHRVDDPIGDPDRALADRFEAGYHPQRRCLAASGRSDEDDELAVVDVEVEVVHGLRAVREDLRYAFEIDLCHAPSAVLIGTQSQALMTGQRGSGQG